VIAHVVTGVRLLLVWPLYLFIGRDDLAATIGAALVIAVAIASDFADGFLARKLGSASAAGRAFDHATDFLFVTAGLVAGIERGVFPALLPALIAVAFAQYVIDSYWLRRERQLVMSQLGRWNGILYFFPLCGDVLIRLGLGFLEPVLWLLCWALVATTAASIGDRALAVVRSRSVRE
jgi:phosphatidylglycerophosphate synthase